MIDDWKVDKVQRPQVQRIVCIQQALFLHPEKLATEPVRAPSLQIDPESLDPLIARRWALDEGTSVQTFTSQLESSVLIEFH